MSRHYPPATEGEMDRLLLIAPVDDALSISSGWRSAIDVASRPLEADEDDPL